jgi:hypothetical protein
VVAVALFAAWLGYLAYLAATTRNPIVLSRPQFLVANLIVVAQVDRVDGQPPAVTVRQVSWPEGDKAPVRPGEQITVTNLSECSGWNKPGEYILALMSDKASYQLAPTPPSPGYHAGGRPPIYPATPETLAQLRDIVARLKSAVNPDLGVQP